MVISVKDGFKLFGISVVCFCAIFVCTFFLNYYIDASDMFIVNDSQKILYDAQMATAKLVCIITGGVLCAIAAIMLIFYIKLFIDGNVKRFGLLKAFGYSNARISLSFWVFGLSVLIGAILGHGLGWAVMPTIYKTLTIDGLPSISPTFHPWLSVTLIAGPSVVFALLACGYAALTLRKNVNVMLKNSGNTDKIKRVSDKSRGFLTEMSISVLRSKKSTVFFVSFSCFCFSAMLQMGMSMRELSSVTMGVMILLIGLVLALTSMIMAVTTVITANVANISIMKAFGYSSVERVKALLIGYIPFALLGFALGTVYQYVLMRIMCDIVYKNVPNMPSYGFDAVAFFITLAAFAVSYALAILFYAIKISRISVKKAMSEDR